MSEPLETLVPIINERGNYLLELTPEQFEQIRYSYDRMLRNRVYNRTKQQELRLKKKEEEETKKALLPKPPSPPTVNVPLLPTHSSPRQGRHTKLTLQFTAPVAITTISPPKLSPPKLSPPKTLTIPLPKSTLLSV